MRAYENASHTFYLLNQDGSLPSKQYVRQACQVGHYETTVASTACTSTCIRSHCTCSGARRYLSHCVLVSMCESTACSNSDPQWGLSGSSSNLQLLPVLYWDSWRDMCQTPGVHCLWGPSTLHLDLKPLDPSPPSSPLPPRPLFSAVALSPASRQYIFALRRHPIRYQASHMFRCNCPTVMCVSYTAGIRRGIG